MAGAKELGQLSDGGTGPGLCSNEKQNVSFVGENRAWVPVFVK